MSCSRQTDWSVSSWLLVLLLQTEARPRPNVWGQGRGRGQNFETETEAEAKILASRPLRLRVLNISEGYYERNESFFCCGSSEWNQNTKGRNRLKNSYNTKLLNYVINKLKTRHHVVVNVAGTRRNRVTGPHKMVTLRSWTPNLLSSSWVFGCQNSDPTV